MISLKDRKSSKSASALNRMPANLRYLKTTTNRHGVPAPGRNIIPVNIIKLRFHTNTDLDPIIA